MTTPTKIDANGIEFDRLDNTLITALSPTGLTISYDLTTSSKLFRLSELGAYWTDGVNFYNTNLDRLCSIQQAFQAVTLPPNSTTLQVNKTLTLNDQAGNVATIGLVGSDLVMSSTAGIVKIDDTLNMNANNIINGGTITATTFNGSLSGNASTATNIQGGLGGSIPYQTAANTTALLANGTSGQVLTSAGTTLAPYWSSSAGASTLNFNINNLTSYKQSINFNSPTTITETNIDAQLDGYNNIEQIYTFGQSIPNRWLALGGTSMAYSLDGNNWSNITSPFTVNGYAIMFNGTRWVSLGEGTNTVSYSTDGLVWTNLGLTVFGTSGRGIDWSSSSNRFVAVGNGTNSISYSSDGITWTGITAKTIFSTTGYGVIYGGTLWVACGAGTNSLAYSYDGVSWLGLGTSIFSTSGRNLFWNGSLFVATGEGTNTLSYSYDGINFVANGSSIFTTIANTVCSNGVIWVAGGAGTNSLAYSYDGINFTGLGTSIFTSCNYISWNNNKFIAVGSGTNTIAYSYNGINWIAQGTSVLPTVGYCIAYNSYRNNRIVFPSNKILAFGQGTNNILYSSDGLNWISVSGNIFTGFAYAGLYDGKKWVALGNGVNTIAYSYDGLTWTGEGLTPFGTSGRSICYSGSRYVAVGDGTNTIAYSSDAITWTGIGSSIFTSIGYACVWTGTRFVAGGNSGGAISTLAYSSDGISWTVVPIFPPIVGNPIFSSACRGLSWNGTRVVGVGGSNNTIAYSSDGLTWTGLGTSIFSVAGYCVANNTVMFVAGGEGANTLAYSFDGISWVGLGNSIFSSRCRGITWVGNKWVAAGNGTNTIAYSYNGVNWVGLGLVFNTIGYGFAWTAAKPAVYMNTITLNSNGTGLSNKLDVVTDTYYNQGFNNMTLTIRV